MPRLIALCVWLLLALSITAATKPNILFVYTDDQAFDTIAALGNTQIQTPQLDALVKSGFVFTNAYCQGGNSPAVCVPSRTMLLTGRNTFHTPMYNAKTYSAPTLGSVFRTAGYETLCVSKPGNSFRPAHDAFEHVVHIPHVGAETNAKCAEATIDFLKSRDRTKPFFIYYAPSMPHDPRTAEPKFHELYDPAKITLPKNAMAKSPIDIGVGNIRDEKLAAYPRDPAEMKKHLADYYACITNLDLHLSRILGQLKDTRDYENTLVVFTSDQGLAVGGRHGHMGKQNLYEHFKSPLIISGPNLKPGKSAALVYLHDLFPTVCDYANIPTPKQCDGQSLLPIIKQEKKAVRDSLVAVYMQSMRMYRNDRWKLIWYPNIKRYQLFDLQTDPDELTNLADDAKHAEQLKAMQSAMITEFKANGDRLFKD